MVTCKLPTAAFLRPAALAAVLAASLLASPAARAGQGPGAPAAPGKSDGAPASAPAANPDAGSLKSLPAFTLPDLEGKPHASSEWQGKVLLVDFWATWCAGCRETIPALSRLQEKYRSQGLAVVGVSLDKGSASKVSRFAKKLKVNYQVLLDAGDTQSKAFGFEGLPSMFLFDREGRLIKAMTGYTALQDKELEGLLAAQFPAAR